MSDERYSVREKHRSRKQLSCAECHRLKLKCDRAVPCANCVRRECAELCPNSVRVKKSRDAPVAELRDRLAAIEGLLAGLGSRDSSRGSSRSRSRERDRRRRHRRREDSDESRSRSRSSSPRERRRARERGYDRERSRDRDRDRDRERDRRQDRERDHGSGRDRGERREQEHRGRDRERRDTSVEELRGEAARAPLNAVASSSAPARTPATQTGSSSHTLLTPNAIPRNPSSSPRDARARLGRDGEYAHGDERPRERSRESRRAGSDRGDRPGTSDRTRPRNSFSYHYDPARPRASPPPNDESYGTLVIDPGGRSKWLGPTAGTEWLKNQEMSETSSPHRSRSPSPSPEHVFEGGLFPFPSWPVNMDAVAHRLPSLEDARVLLDAYYDNYAWNHDVAPRRSVQPLLDRMYDESGPEPARRVHPQQLALLFITMAMGALHNPELPPHDPSAEQYLAAARWCLVKGDFIGHNTIAGLQALVIMAHYHLETEKGRNGDNAWPLWGLAMRLVTAMGLHRDGERWNLPAHVVEERRHVFWECHTIDVFQANCFSRPSSLRPEHIDTEFPSQSWSDGRGGLKSFRTLKFELCRISGAVLDQAMDVRPTPYTAITSLYDRLCAFERQIPFHLRCRAALLSLPSVYADADSATRDSPAVNRADLHCTFQQYTLALNVSECILFLQRPYFVKALQEAPQDPTRSAYGKSYLAVVERCNVLIEIVAGLYELYPTVTARHWFFWYHLFTAAVCIGTMIIKNSSNPLAGLAIAQIDHSLRLYSAVLRDHPTPSLVQNHAWLLRLRQRALSKLEAGQQADADTDADDDVDIELLGWRTRLIERARGHAHHFRDHHHHETHHAHRTSASAAPLPSPNAPAPIQQLLQQHFVVPPGDAGQQSTDLFLHQFWDPTTLLETRNAPGFANANWWNFDTQLGLDPSLMGNMMP